MVNCDWLITYDDAPEIEKIYEKYCIRRIELNYSVGKKRKANELVIFEAHDSIPDIGDLIKNNIRLNLK